MKRGRNQRRRQGMNINRALDSNGPDVRIRGTANQIYDKYQALARDAASAGDRVKAENYLQHAEHYYRMIRSIQQTQQQPSDNMDAEGDQPSLGGDRHGQRPRRDQDDDDMSEDDAPQQPRARNGASSEDRAEAQDSDGDQDDSAAKEKRPRRRRPRKPSAEDGEKSEKTAEAAAS